MVLCGAMISAKPVHQVQKWCFEINKFKDASRIHSQPKVQYEQNFSTSRYKQNNKKISHIKEVKNIYFG